MRFLPLALLAAMLLATPTMAQPTEYGFSEDYLVRIGQGDLQLVNGTEPADAWTQAEYLRFTHDGVETRIEIHSAEHRLSTDCTCQNHSFDGSHFVVGSNEPAGQYVMRLVLSIPGDYTIAELDLFQQQASSRLVAYVPNGYELFSNQDEGDGLTCTTGDCTIHEISPIGAHPFIIGQEGLFFQPDRAIPAPETDDGMLDDVLPWIAGILVGALLWAFLVKQGYVQKRRKQEIQKAAHVQVAESEGKPTLEARKRVLMSGLKELEKAKMAKEIDSDVYDQLKAELKKETVTVMRAIEAAE